MLRAVAARPDRLLVLFVGGAPHQHAQAVLTACSRDEPWAELDHAYWCPVVATCWPAALGRDLVAHVAQQQWPKTFRSDDEIVGRFIRAAGHRPLATVPSLVQHPDVVTSLIGKKAAAGRNTDRVAACYIGDCAGCALEIDWTPGPG